LLLVGLTFATVRQGAVERGEVNANLGQLAGNVRQDLLAGAARAQDGREALVPPLEKSEDPREEGRAGGGTDVLPELNCLR
jgi:hypothetical protein